MIDKERYTVTMKQQVKFLHTADFHLGSSFRGLRALSETWARRLLSAIADSFNKVIDIAIDQEVDFVVIAGDVFDGTQTSYADYLCFQNGLERLHEEGIDAYISCGNHDPLSSWQKDFSQLPANTILFPSDKPGFFVFEKNGHALVTLCGRSYATKNWPAEEDISEGISRTQAQEATGIETPFAIGVIHSGFTLDRGYSPTDPAKLMRADMDYWALGHIHEPYKYPSEDPSIVFPGCIQGRDINEQDEKGVFVVTLEEGKKRTFSFFPTAGVVWKRLEVDIKECATVSEVGSRIVQMMVNAASASGCEEVCARVTLTGVGDLKRTLSCPGVIEDLRKNINDTYPLFYCDAIVDKSHMPLDRNALKKEGLFPAVFMEAARNQKQAPELAHRAIQEEFLEKGISLTLYDDKNIDLLLAEAEDFVLELLEQGDF